MEAESAVVDAEYESLVAEASLELETSRRVVSAEALRRELESVRSDELARVRSQRHALEAARRDDDERLTSPRPSVPRSPASPRFVIEGDHGLSLSQLTTEHTVHHRSGPPVSPSRVVYHEPGDVEELRRMVRERDDTIARLKGSLAAAENSLAYAQEQLTAANAANSVLLNQVHTLQRSAEDAGPVYREPRSEVDHDNVVREVAALRKRLLALESSYNANTLRYALYDAIRI